MGGVNDKFKQAEEKIGEFETIEITQSVERKEKKMKKSKKSLKNPWDTIEQSSMHTMGVLEGEGRENNIGRYNDWKHLKLDERFMSTHPISSMKSKLLKA